LHKIGSENACGCTQNAENGFGFDFLDQNHKDSNKFLSHIVTGDETQISFMNPETTEQSVKVVGEYIFTN
jgi:hypothetical protein